MKIIHIMLILILFSTTSYAVGWGAWGGAAQGTGQSVSQGIGQGIANSLQLKEMQMMEEQRQQPEQQRFDDEQLHVIEYYNEAIRLKPDYAEAYNNRGLAYLLQGNYELGCRDAQKGCELGYCKALEWAKGKGYCPTSAPEPQPHSYPATEQAPAPAPEQAPAPAPAK
jgi:tetratricopeptide (TPR) repeat protein